MTMTVINSAQGTIGSPYTVTLDTTGANFIWLALPNGSVRTTGSTITSSRGNVAIALTIAQITYYHTQLFYCVSPTNPGPGDTWADPLGSSSPAIIQAYACSASSAYSLVAEADANDATYASHSTTGAAYQKNFGAMTPDGDDNFYIWSVQIGSAVPGTVTLGSAGTLGLVTNLNPGTASAYYNQATAAAFTPDITWTNDSRYAAAAAVFKPAGGGGGSAPAVTVNPANASVTQPATANFTATATGATSLQWQYSSDGGTTWASVTDGTGGTTGTTSGSYTTAATAVSSGTWRNGYKVRCAFTNTTGTTYSTAATLTVTGASAVGTVRAYYENLKGSRNV